MAQPMTLFAVLFFLFTLTTASHSIWTNKPGHEHHVQRLYEMLGNTFQVTDDIHIEGLVIADDEESLAQYHAMQNRSFPFVTTREFQDAPLRFIRPRAPTGYSVDVLQCNVDPGPDQDRHWNEQQQQLINNKICHFLANNFDSATYAVGFVFGHAACGTGWGLVCHFFGGIAMLQAGKYISPNIVKFCGPIMSEIPNHCHYLGGDEGLTDKATGNRFIADLKATTKSRNFCRPDAHTKCGFYDCGSGECKVGTPPPK